MIKPRIDRDSKAYQDKILKRKYAGYTSGRRKSGYSDDQILSFEEWRDRVALREEHLLSDVYDV